MTDHRSYVRTVARTHFDAARRLEWIAAMVDSLRHAPHDLLSFEEVRQRLQIRGQHALGIQTVPIDHIIGSEGRYGDFDRHFLPKGDHTRERWVSIDTAVQTYVHLPPVDLYKVGDVYFVRDGNHRISVARQQGQRDIDANVIELYVDVPLTAQLRPDELPIVEEYADFLEWTQLHKLRPDQKIEFSEQGGYLELIRHINAHRYFMGIDYQRPISINEAIMNWYDNVYMPVIRAIRRQQVLRLFPGRTEADLYCWVMQHRWYMLERAEGRDPGPDAALTNFVESFGGDHWLKRLGMRISQIIDESYGIRGD